PGNVQALLAAPAQLVETDRRERADQGETGGERKQERQQGVAQDRPRQDQTDDGVDQAQEYGMARDGGKNGPAARERRFEIRKTHLADFRTRPDRIRTPSNRQLRHGPTSLATRAPAPYLGVA